MSVAVVVEGGGRRKSGCANCDTSANTTNLPSPEAAVSDASDSSAATAQTTANASERIRQRRVANEDPKELLDEPTQQ